MNWKLVLRRVPPGDNWVFDGSITTDGNSKTYPTLTAALNAVFLVTKQTTFLVNSGEGTVSIPNDEKISPDTYSLYGE